jgi:predicted RND superfamily exporter protein
MQEIIIGILIVIGVVLLLILQGMVLASLSNEAEQSERQAAILAKRKRMPSKKQEKPAINGASVKRHTGFEHKTQRA